LGCSDIISSSFFALLFYDLSIACSVLAVSMSDSVASFFGICRSLSLFLPSATRFGYSLAVFSSSAAVFSSSVTFPRLSG
jgi:hypothetical protein